MKKSFKNRIPIIAMIFFIPTLIYQLLSDDPTHAKKLQHLLQGRLRDPNDIFLLALQLILCILMLPVVMPGKKNKT